MIKSKKRGGINEWNYIPRIHGDEFRNMYKALANHYLRHFCLFVGLDYNDADWVADEPGGIAVINGLLVDYDDVRLVVDNRLTGETFFGWRKYADEIERLESKLREGEKFTTLKRISLRAYAASATLPYDENELKIMADAADK